jgi:excinuclease ABC subunit B
VAILDADKEGFLRSKTSLIQTAGRAARHAQGRVVMYADTITESIRQTIEISKERREKQEAYNLKNGITPKTVQRDIGDGLQPTNSYPEKEPSVTSVEEGNAEAKEVIAELEVAMLEAAQKLEFEKAAMLRDQIDSLKKNKENAYGSSKPLKKRKSRGVYNKDGLPIRKQGR